MLGSVYYGMIEKNLAKENTIDTSLAVDYLNGSGLFLENELHLINFHVNAFPF